LLINSDADLESLADFYAQKYGTPEYRFEAVDILLDELTTQQQTDLLDLELGDVVEIKFTPNLLPPAISKYAEIISINHAIDLNNHILTFGFATLDFAVFVLDDLEFGKLDSGNALAF
jgi:poly-gamma-glutamate capsule biosynthesis protein CapA/YwtB (metallophosphatase superfamily)